MSGLNIRYHGHTAMEMFEAGVRQHKALYGTLPYRIWLSADLQEEMQRATGLVVESQEVLISYRANQDQYTVGCDTTKQGNRKIKRPVEPK